LSDNRRRYDSGAILVNGLSDRIGNGAVVPDVIAVPTEGDGHLPARPRTPAATPQREAVVTAIRRAVVLGELTPGEKLREVRLASALDVSRPTLREALNLLVQEGWLVQQPYRGYSVTALDPAAIKDIARTRVPLDLIAVTGILEDPSGRRLQLVRNAWERYAAVGPDADPLAQHEAHVALHHGIWVASENSMLLRLWPVMEALTTIALAQEQAARHDPERAHRVHHDLVEAILNRDPARIERELTRHTLDSAEELLTLHQLRADSTGTSGREPPARRPLRDQQ
jgi:DNA-binding GntR family transcriptional regulator